MKLLIVLSLSIGSLFSPFVADINGMANHAPDEICATPSSQNLSFYTTSYNSSTTPITEADNDLLTTYIECIDEEISSAILEKDPQKLLDRVSVKYSKFESIEVLIKNVTIFRLKKAKEGSPVRVRSL